MGALSSWWWKFRRALRRVRGPYGRWTITRWETPVSDIDRLLLVSLTDVGGRLTATFEAAWETERRRWAVTFPEAHAYRNADEVNHTALWSWLNSSGQRCGSTFTVERSPWVAELVEWRSRHYVLCTLDDIVEVVAGADPVWEALAPAESGAPRPGKTQHYFLGEDDAEIEALATDIERRKQPGKAG